ncbi:MAG: hypothetical protein JRI68_28765, partial [Deltaproteobacteria bacterium]|nr:hypothetical protein [Deltaproteobacteria bacterium]
MARLSQRPSRPARRTRYGVATLACLVVAGLVTTVTWAARDGARPHARAIQVGLSAVPVPAVERFPRLTPAPLPEPAVPEPPTLRLERLDGTLLCEVVPFDGTGEPRPAAFATIEAIFRPRSGHQPAIHPRLVEMLLLLSQAYDGRPIGLVSGFREAGRQTRQTSYHVKGMAADIAIRWVKVHDLRN